MKIRSLVAAATVAAFAMAGCGGSDGPSTLSEDDFVDEMADICKDTERDLDRIDEPQSVSDLEDSAAEAVDILTETRERLSEIVPPEDLAADFEDFVDNVDDQIAAMEDLQKAGKDDDEDAANEAGEELGRLSEKRIDLGEDLGVDDCAIDEDADEPTVTEPPVTAPPDTTPLTLPVTVPPQTVPPATAPPATAPPLTAPPVTEAPAVGQLFSVVDLSTIFVGPPGFTLVNSDPAAAQGFIDIVAGIPELNNGISEMGVGVLLDDTGDAVATIVVGVSIGDAMPGQWKDILCVNGILRTSANGFTGIVCDGEPGTNVAEIFTMTEGDIGLSVASLVEGVPADLVVDAFFEANFE